MAMTFIIAAKAGLSSPSVRLYQAGADTLLNAGGDTLTPGTNGTGQYTATIAETLSGSIYYEVLSGGLVYRNGFFKAVDGSTVYAGEFTSSDLTAINAEVVDGLAVDTYAEPGQGAPAATTTLAAKVNYIYKAWRNKKTQTSTTHNLFADDATTVDQKATVSDDGTTTTVGEIATGP